MGRMLRGRGGHSTIWLGADSSLLSQEDISTADCTMKRKVMNRARKKI